MPWVSEEHLEARRQQIVDAAVWCFAKSGIHGTSLDDIRLAADLSHGAVYHYFKSKEDIIDALRERSLEEDQEILEGVKETRPSALGADDQDGDDAEPWHPENAHARVAMFTGKFWTGPLSSEDGS